MFHNLPGCFPYTACDINGANSFRICQSVAANDTAADKERMNPIVREKRTSLPNCNNTAAKATGRKAQYGGMREGAC